MYVLVLGCRDANAETSRCAIDISHNIIGRTSYYGAQNAWSRGDTKLDWYGAQKGQVSHLKSHLELHEIFNIYPIRAA